MHRRSSQLSQAVHPRSPPKAFTVSFHNHNVIRTHTHLHSVINSFESLHRSKSLLTNNFQSKKVMNRRPNERLASKIKLGGVESAHDYIFSAAVAQLSPMAIVDDLKKQGHQYPLEHVRDIIKVHHPEEVYNTLYEGSMFTARFILEVGRNGNLSAAAVAEKANNRGVGGRSIITPEMVIGIRNIDRQATAILIRGHKQEGWEDAVLCLFILGYSPEEINSICRAFINPCPANNLLQIQNITKKEAHPGDEQSIIWQTAAHILDTEAKSYILNAFFFNIPINEIT